MPPLPARFIAGNSPQATSLQDWNRGQLQSGVTLLQPGSTSFRASEAFQKATFSAGGGSDADLTELQQAVAQLQGQVQTLSSQVSTLQQQFINIQNYLMFTQSEQPTGMIFLDGNQIYKRSWVISGMNVVNNVYTIAHGIQNLAYLAQAQGVMGVANSTNVPLTWINSALALPQWGDATCFYIDNVNIYIVNGSVNRSSFLFLITLWYTRIGAGGNVIPGT